MKYFIRKKEKAFYLDRSLAQDGYVSFTSEKSEALVFPSLSVAKSMIKSLGSTAKKELGVEPKEGE